MGENQENEYIPYPKAFKVLNERLGITPGELAVWVYWGPEEDLGGIAAYHYRNRQKEPVRYPFSHLPENWSTYPYLKRLMATWYLKNDVETFQPASRYVNWEQISDRWGVVESIDAAEYIQKCIHEDRLQPIHPVTGAVSSRDWYVPELPSVEDGYYDLAEIEQIEIEDGIEGLKPNETPEQRKERLHRWLAAERKKDNPRGAIKRTAEREQISRSTLNGILNRPIKK